MGYTVPLPLCDPPPTLLELSARYCIDNISTTIGCTDKVGLKEGVALPSEVCQTLLDVADKTSESFEAHIVPLFRDPTRSRLCHLPLRGSILSPRALSILMSHKPYTLDISSCSSLTPEVLTDLNNFSSNLVSFTVGNTTQIFPEILPREEGDPFLPILRAPKLKQLSIHEYVGEAGFWKSLLPDWKELTHLDLSGCGEIEGLEFLEEAESLVWLCLYNVGIEDAGLRRIAKCSRLRHLDLSQSNESTSVFQSARDTLTNLIRSLPSLSSLDISGTNLAGRGVAESSDNCDIPGLETRVENPLDFLGLYGAHHDASHRHHIPAKRIAGDKDETQVLVACQAYLDRSELLEKILNDLFHLHRAEKGSQVKLSLDLILQAMSRHFGEKHVQISGSASLFYIVRNNDKSSIDSITKKRILSTLITAMEMHKFDSTMMRNGCLTICLFKVPQDVLFQYEKLVRVLLDILGNPGQEDFVERIAIYLLNSLACQVDGPQKKLVGELGAIQKMLELIQTRLNKNECDDVMEIAWSTMWNVTDETPENCRLFLEGQGMDLFLQCLRAFQNKAELLRNMMGLLGNVAEVPALRPQLMNKDFISVFYSLLDSTQDNIEVSYNAAGVLAHILSDGDRAWNISSPMRNDVMEKLSSNVLRWDVNSQRNINYRSFEPILRLLLVNVEVCNLWAVWALANLTRVYPDKYCSLLVAENGLKLLETLKSAPGGVGIYAAMAIENVRLEANKEDESSNSGSGESMVLEEK